jgi:phage terminase Nu1 subunit (DNA packaging protein)
MSKNLTEKELAVILNVSIRTLQDWRQRGCGPSYLKLNKSVRYPSDNVDAFVAKALVSSTSAVAA